MAEPIMKLTRGVPKNDREWMDVFSKLTKHLRVEGDRLVITPEIELPPSAALSVMGRAVNTPGAPADIVAGADATFLRRTGNTLGFTTIVDSDIPSTVARQTDIATAIDAHEALPDPHPQYTTASEVSAALAIHEAAADPHTGYALENAAVFTAPPVLPSYTVATLPSVATYACGLIYVSDESGGAVPAFSDGTDWRRITDRNIVS